MPQSDEYWMQQALTLAQQAEANGEVPVGAVLIKEDKLIASGFNQPITMSDPSAHAEMVALRAAGNVLSNYRLLDTTLYVTLEPCAMCAHAMIHARIKRCVFGAYDPKTGAAGSVVNAFTQPYVNHQVLCDGGVLADECGALLKNFFQQRRNKN